MKASRERPSETPSVCAVPCLSTTKSVPRTPRLLHRSVHSQMCLLLSDPALAKETLPAHVLVAFSRIRCEAAGVKGLPIRTTHRVWVAKQSTSFTIQSTRQNEALLRGVRDATGHASSPVIMKRHHSLLRRKLDRRVAPCHSRLSIVIASAKCIDSSARNERRRLT